MHDVAAIANTSPDAVMTVIDYFCEQNRSFLVLLSHNTEDNPLIDISHESLIRQWNKLDNG
ncbi:hypothetical protein [Leucothrix pacifica]|uniref:Uncharacterized protein n=1 Tax=Leucothrix pacifica TaxID=1247513 RepID=A0A317C582_9GAMM|nr:hypothetical protein [Leucothrix pacifica]PWQ92523.1 hypothetical protein DKW60_20715 [Leucothrix pacifica]